MPKVQLHCPSTKKTVDGFFIGDQSTPTAVIQAVRIELSINYAALFTSETKPIADPKTLEDGSRVLVAASQGEKMLPDAPSAWVFYDGEEAEDIHPDSDVYGLEWEGFDNKEQRLHITSLNEEKPETRNKLRITHTYELVQKGLAAIDASASSSSTSVNPEDLIEACWDTTIEKFLPASMKPDKNKTVGKSLDPQVLATIGVLSSFTHGQSRLAREVLVEAVALRTQEDQTDPANKDPVVWKKDVEIAIDMLYERAGLITLKITKPKTEIAKGKEARKAEREKKKAAGKGKGKKAGDEEET